MIKRTLMKRNQELLDFEVDLAAGTVHVLDVLAAEDDLAISTHRDAHGRDEALATFLRRRAISSNRIDRDDIFAAFGVRSAVELALMGHGLSLSDLFWYRTPGSGERWEDVNFFDNEWDQGFGSAVLSGDCARLANCSPDVPDVTTPGHAIKAWERTEDGIFLVKISKRFNGADLVGAKLASDMCTLLLDEGSYVPLSIVERYGKTCCASPLMLSGNEEFADGNRLCAIAGVQEVRDVDASITAETCDARIDAYTAIGVRDAQTHVAKLAACLCLSLLSDFHSGNYGAIRNVDSGAWRAAPLFDYDGSFGFPFYDSMIETLCSQPGLALLLCACSFSYLRPTWDWSWYDPRALEGFEGRIIEAYAACQGLPPNFADIVARLFVIQRNYVNDVAAGRVPNPQLP